MKIGYLCPFDKLWCGESEARIRWTYLFQKKGHEVIELNRECRSFDSDIHGENLNLDLIVSPAAVEHKDAVFPDAFSCIFFWCPTSFFPNLLRRNNYLLYMGKYDCVVGGYESRNPVAELAASCYFNCGKMLPSMASVPTDFAVFGELPAQLKLFYVGVLPRYEKLLSKLDNSGRLDIYGHETAFGISPWKKFKSYRGNIPFDGVSIIKKMHESGIVLALHSKSHNTEEFVSNRIFEAAAAGAIIIADDNKFIRRYFGDNVYYVDIYQSEEALEKSLNKVIEKIYSDPAAARLKAKNAQQIFLDKLALDRQVDDFLTFIENKKSEQCVSDFGLIDCIVKAETAEEFFRVQTQLEKQYYRHLHTILVASRSVFEEAKSKSKCDFDFAEDDGGYFGENIVGKLKGKYFVVLNSESVLNGNHLLKAAQLLHKTNDLFVYSGSFEKTQKNGVVDFSLLNSNPLNLREFLLDAVYCELPIFGGIDVVADYPQACFIFNRELIENGAETANVRFSEIHTYLCAKSLLIDFDRKAFMYVFSAGRTAPHKKRVKNVVFDRSGTSSDSATSRIRSNLVHLIAKKDIRLSVADILKKTGLFKIVSRYFVLKKFSLSKRRRKLFRYLKGELGKII